MIRPQLLAQKGKNVIASEARQSRASGLHGLPRRCAPRNDGTYVAIGRATHG